MIAADGSRKRKTLYAKTRQECAKKLARAIADRDGGVLFDAGTTTLSAYVDSYLQDAARRVRPKTHRRYCNLAKVHLLPTLGKMKLSALTPDRLRALYRQRLDAALSARTVQHAHVLLTQILKQTVADGLIPRNPAESVCPRGQPRRSSGP